MNRTILSVAAVLWLSACGQNPISDLVTRSDPLPDMLPAMKTFAPGPPDAALAKSNHDIARDFLELTFQLESGKILTRMTRFEGPVTVALATHQGPQFEADLAALLARLRTEAGLDISQSKTGQPANIVIETLPRKSLHALVPQAACFVVPRVTSWSDFRKNRRSGKLDWSTLEMRDRATVFIPDDVSPQEARDCLHEEIAQALGPLNDIYRLADSIFNDDNMNTVLTPEDMRILRIYYTPQLRNGMTRAEVEEKLPTILASLNPDGEKIANDGQGETPRQWIDTLEQALGPQASRGRRVIEAEAAVSTAKTQGWSDNRLGFSLFALGRLALGQDPALAVDSFKQAYEVYAKLYGPGDIHTAHVALQLAAFSLSSGDSKAALGYINDSVPVVAKAQNASLLAAFLMIKAEALEFEGRLSEANAVRLDSIGWARYGFATDTEIRARLRETAALRPGVKKPGA